MPDEPIRTDQDTTDDDTGKDDTGKDDPGKDDPGKDDTEQRGSDPTGHFGHTDPPAGDLDPDWTPTDHVRREALDLLRDIGKEHRPHREDVLPYLLIRAFSPGDRGARPIWPTTPSWESPDIILIDASYTGPFSPARSVIAPQAGRSYRVFVRVWNLGLLPAIGVHVRAWVVDPGFFGGDPTNPAYQPRLIGGALVSLEDRTRPGAMQVVELDTRWDIPTTLTGHECLLASAGCPADQWSGVLDANHDRHVAQRNLTIAAGAQDLSGMFVTLGQRISPEGTIELWHGAGAVRPLLQAIGGRGRTGVGPLGRLATPRAAALSHGVMVGSTRHLATMFRVDGGWLIADSARVWATALELGLFKRGRQVRWEPGSADVGRASGSSARVGSPFAERLGSRRLIERIGLTRVEAFGVVIDGDPGKALATGVMRLWGIDRLTGQALAGAMGWDRAAHLLRIGHHDPQLNEEGGYSLIVIGE